MAISGFHWFALQFFGEPLFFALEEEASDDWELLQSDHKEVELMEFTSKQQAPMSELPSDISCLEPVLIELEPKQLAPIEAIPLDLSCLELSRHMRLKTFFRYSTVSPNLRLAAIKMIACDSLQLSRACSEIIRHPNGDLALGLLKQYARSDYKLTIFCAFRHVPRLEQIFKHFGKIDSVTLIDDGSQQIAIGPPLVRECIVQNGSDEIAKSLSAGDAAKAYELLNRSYLPKDKRNAYLKEIVELNPEFIKPRLEHAFFANDDLYRSATADLCREQNYLPGLFLLERIARWNMPPKTIIGELLCAGALTDEYLHPWIFVWQRKDMLTQAYCELVRIELAGGPLFTLSPLFDNCTKGDQLRLAGDRLLHQLERQARRNSPDLFETVTDVFEEEYSNRDRWRVFLFLHRSDLFYPLRIALLKKIGAAIPEDGVSAHVRHIYANRATLNAFFNAFIRRDEDARSDLAHLFLVSFLSDCSDSLEYQIAVLGDNIWNVQNHDQEPENLASMVGTLHSFAARVHKMRDHSQDIDIQIFASEFYQKVYDLMNQKYLLPETRKSYIKKILECNPSFINARLEYWLHMSPEKQPDFIKKTAELCQKQGHMAGLFFLQHCNTKNHLKNESLLRVIKRLLDERLPIDTCLPPWIAYWQIKDINEIALVYQQLERIEQDGGPAFSLARLLASCPRRLQKKLAPGGKRFPRLHPEVATDYFERAVDNYLKRGDIDGVLTIALKLQSPEFAQHASQHMLHSLIPLDKRRSYLETIVQIDPSNYKARLELAFYKQEFRTAYFRETVELCLQEKYLPGLLFLHHQKYVSGLDIVSQVSELVQNHVPELATWPTGCFELLEGFARYELIPLSDLVLPWFAFWETKRFDDKFNVHDLRQVAHFLKKHVLYPERTNQIVERISDIEGLTKAFQGFHL